MKRRPAPAALQKACDEFNERHPIGAAIIFWRGRAGDGPGTAGTVTAPGAYVLGGHTAVVQVGGGCIALTHVVAAPAEVRA